MTIRSAWTWLATATAGLVIGATLGVAPASAADSTYKVLVFSKTAGFGHSSGGSGSLFDVDEFTLSNS